jgi:hypothetical protein
VDRGDAVSIIDDLRGKAEYAREEADRYREKIASNDALNAIYRKKIDDAELEAVGATVAANILEGIDLTVDRVDGVPRVRFAALDPKP